MLSLRGLTLLRGATRRFYASGAAPINLTGEWKLYKTENMDGFLKEMEINWLLRKIVSFGGMSGGNMQHFITQNGDDIVVEAKGPKGKATETFTVGVETEMPMQPSGTPAKFIAHWKDGKLDCLVTPLDPSKKPQRLTRELTHDGKEMLVEIHMGNEVCKRFFSK